MPAVEAAEVCDIWITVTGDITPLAGVPHNCRQFFATKSAVGSIVVTASVVDSTAEFTIPLP